MAHSFLWAPLLTPVGFVLGQGERGSLQSVSLQGGWEVEGVVRSMEAGASMGAGFGVSLLLITAASHCEGAQDLIALSGEKLLPCP